MEIVITRNVSIWLPYINVSIRQKNEPYICSMYADKIEFESDMIYGFMSNRLSFAISTYEHKIKIVNTC